MADNKIPAEILSSSSDVRPATAADALPRPSMWSRLTARLRADRYDRLLAVGVPAPEGSALAAHEARLTSTAEREAIARSLRAIVADARGRGLLLVPGATARAQPRCGRGRDRRDHLAIAFTATGERAGNGAAAPDPERRAGPLYRYGRGDLRGRLGAALAAL